jgi:voltage-gated potassium channel Kch
MSLGLTGHYVVCNWTPKSLPLIKQLRSDLLRNERRTVVVITDKPINNELLVASSEGSSRDLPHSDEDDTSRAGRGALKDVVFYPGDPTDERVLAAVSVEQSHSVIVLADQDLGEEADARTLLTLFALKGIEKCSRDRGLPRMINTVAEIVSVHNYAKFKSFEQESRGRATPDGRGLVEIIRAESLQTRILAQAARTPGLVSLYTDLLTFSRESNEIYYERLPRELIEHCDTFSELALEILDIETIDGDGQPIDVVPIGLMRDNEFYLNPLPEEESLREGDCMVMISPSQPDLLTSFRGRRQDATVFEAELQTESSEPCGEGPDGRASSCHPDQER